MGIDKLQLGAVPLSPDILGKANIGLWAFELDEGSEPRMYDDNTMLGLVGLDHQVPPEEAYHAWYDNIDKDSYGLVTDAVAKMCAGEHAEVQYPWHHPDGRTMIVRCGGVRNWDYKKGIRIEGTHQDVTEMLHFDEEQRKRALVDSETVSGIASEYLSMYNVNLDSSNEYTVYSFDEERQKDTKKLIDKIPDFFDMLHQFAKNSVHPDDRHLFLDLTQDSLREKLAHRKKLNARYRRDYGSGFLWSEVDIIKCEDIDEPAHTVIIGFIERDSDIRQEQNQHALSDGLAREYHTVWLVDGFGEHHLHLYRSTGKKTVKKAVDLGLRVPSYDIAMTQYVMDSVHEDDRKRVLEATRFETIARETPDVGTYVVSYKRYNDEGTVDYHQMCFAKAVADDGTVNYILAYRDADKMLREQIAMQNKLQDALTQAQNANAAKTLFMNSMSHDIRTPMNAIIGYTSMAQKYIDDKEKTSGYLNKIGIAGNNLLGLVNQVLDMSRIDSGKVVLKEEPNDVVDRAYEMTEIMGHAATAKNIQITTNIHQVKDRKVYADSGRVNQLVMNILGNAVKYTPEGGRVDYSVTQIPCDKTGYGTYVITIQDNGIGMSSEYLAHIFEPFTRENTSTVSKIQGTGLGMSIVKKLIDLMDGDISIESEQGKGTKIEVTMTFRLQEKEHRTSNVKSDVNGANVLTGKRVLLVEDNEMNREIATMLLEDQGLYVETAEDGDVAVSIMKELAEREEWFHFDFILMDVQMPRMNGYQATAAIRAIPVPDGLHMPIIAMTANAFAEDRQTAIDAGMDDHIAKPIDVQALWDTLSKYV